MDAIGKRMADVYKERKLMRYLDKLLDGERVEWKPLMEIAKIKNGKDYKHLSMGDIPVYGSGGIMTYVNAYSYNRPSVLIPRKGSLNNLFYVDSPFWNVDTIFYTEIDSSILLPKFLYYFLSTLHLENLNLAGGVPSLTQKILNTLLIPIPCPDNPEKSLEIQRKLVGILDKFTELEAELEAELACRKRQYEYYRNQLLSFDMLNGGGKMLNDVMIVALGEVSAIKRGKRLIRKELSISGSFAVFQNSMTPLGYYNIANVNRNTTFIISAGAAGEIGYSNNEFWAADDVYYFIPKEYLMGKYLYYFLLTQQAQLKKKVRRASVPRLAKSAFDRLLIPVPPLEVQRRIVSILDKFDTLTASISGGLPKEIELRRKQYEYYRDQLLSFPNNGITA